MTSTLRKRDLRPCCAKEVFCAAKTRRKNDARGTRHWGLKRTVCRRGHRNYFQNLVPLLVTPTDRLSSCVRGVALVCKRERTWLAIAGVRRLLPFRSNETDKPRHELRSRFPRRVEILRAISDTRYRPLSWRRVACSCSSPFIDARAFCSPTQVSRWF